MFKLGEKVYYMHDNIIRDGYVVGRQENNLRNKPTQVLYLGGKVSTIDTNRATAGANDPTKKVADRYRKEGRASYEKDGARDLSRAENDGLNSVDKRFKTGEKRYEPKNPK